MIFIAGQILPKKVTGIHLLSIKIKTPEIFGRKEF